MALDSDASAVAARVFNRSGTSKRRASAVQSTRSTLARAPLAALGVMQLQRRVGAASRAFDQSTVELQFKLAGSTAGIRENPDPTHCSRRRFSHRVTGPPLEIDVRRRRREKPG